MGFLSGVLEGVKDDPSVTTYYKNMETTLKKIKDSMHNPDGLSKAVDAVSRALGEWDRELTGKTDALKDRLNELKTNDFTNFDKSLSDLKTCNSSDVASKLETLINNASYMFHALTLIDKCFDDLDPELHNKLRDYLGRVKFEIGTLFAAAKNEPLKAVVETANKRLGALEITVKDTVFHKVRDVQQEIDREFNRKIQNPITNVNRYLTEVQSNLHSWIQKANDVFSAALKKIDAIVKILNASEEATQPTKRKAVEEAAEQLQVKADELRKAAFKAKEELSRKVTAALAQVLKLDRAVREGLCNLKGGIEKGMNDYVKSKLLENIKKNLNKVIKGDGGEGLEPIVENVRKYSENFRGNGKNDGFRSIVEGWIVDILREEPVKGYLDEYFKAKDNLNAPYGTWKTAGDNTEITKTIAGIIMPELNEEINAAVEAVKRVTPDTSMNHHINAVQLGCDKFATALGEKLRNDSSHVLLIAIVKAIGNAARGTAQFHKSRELINAVEATLYQLIGVANTAGEGIKSFIMDNTNMSANVDNALRLARNLISDIETATTASSHSVKAIPPDEGFTPTEKVEGRILGIVENEVGTIHVGALPDKLKPSTKNFSEYFRSVAEDAVGKHELIGDEGQLPQSIREIKTAVNDDAAHLGDVEKGNGAKTNDGKFYEDTFSTLLGTLDTKFKAFIEAVEDLVKGTANRDGDTVHAYLEELNGMVNQSDKHVLKCTVSGSVQGLQHINSEILKILGNHAAHNPDPQGNLKTIVQNAEEFYKTVATQAASAISDIQKYVTEQVYNATAGIQDNAKYEYLNNIQRMFLTMKAKVTAYVSDIDTTIDLDLKSNVKGLLRLMMDHEHKHQDAANKLKKLDVSGVQERERVKTFAGNVRDYLRPVLHHIEGEVKTPGNPDMKGPASSKQENEASKKIYETHGGIGKLLGGLKNNDNKKYNFDHDFAKLLGNLKTSILGLSPSKFDGHHNTRLLDATKTGLDAFHQELYKAYVNAYAGQPVGVLLGPDDKLTPEGRNLSKVFLTILTFFKHAFDVLKDNCDAKGAWGDKMLSLVSKPNIHNPLGAFLEKSGFVVSRSESSHDGELRCHKQTTGIKIHRDIVSPKVSRITTPPLVGTIDDLHDCLEKYNEVGHVLNFSAKRQPCSVYEMLIWLGGLTYTSVYSNMLGIPLSDLFEDPNKDTADGNTATLISEVTLDAQPNNIRYNDVFASINDICAKSYDVLITIAGTGDADTIYASDFCNNSMRFHYPAAGEECLQMLIDMLRSLLPALKYLFNQCNINAEDCGWADCLYGKAVSTSNWQCKNHSTDKPKCQAKCDSNIQPTCQPRSPLMSHLNDCLPGHLPHKLNSIGCKVKCSTCPKSTPGMPCLTPLGFKQFSGSTRTGRELCEMLRYFLGTGTISSLLSLVPRPPSSLPEHFGFALSLVGGWQSIATHPLKTVIQSEIDNVSISLCKTPGKLTDALRYVYGSRQTDHGAFHPDSERADLSSLTMSIMCPAYGCAPYIQGLSSDIYKYLAHNHANVYLSWAIYLPWTFWDLLNNLYNAFCSINCHDWGCRGCLRGDKCKKGDHGSIHETTKQSNCQCPSIVDCKGVAPTLYQFGFVFGEASTLNGESPKKCSDFCSQLRNVLNSQYFKDLFKECDNFLWTIRQPFTYLVLTLWLLSLLYLLHIMVIRLDLLHIKSHLHSPSSHRIAAQSLLAAARVNKLNRVFYLQP